ncbi:cytochrome c oxidase subunit 3 [Aureivirga sp. CE67]|uniref:cytochrome c oxidase subunit 3 n=1 Tax=Aureivirga sp. CE67 TaxID=1788983 RepID=UPI0018CA4570|nr:cytochrome c oxidase subunit 3 [Aureivirga sp. CE67]
MEANYAATNNEGKTWDGGSAKPLGASYGKMMMWFFIMSDALTFSGFLAAYGLMRFKFIDTWPIADEVFTHIPFIHGDYPMYYVAFMSFVLIFSSVTMVLAVDAGKQMKKATVAFYMFLTILGGIIFVGSQAWEWNTFIKGSYGAVKLNDGKIIQFVDSNGHKVALEDFVAATPYGVREEHTRDKGLWFVEDNNYKEYTVEQVIAGFKAHPELSIVTEKLNHETREKQIVPHAEAFGFLNEAKTVVKGANLKENEYGNTLFGDFFFFITGFHGFHVISGIVLNIIIFFNVLLGTYERRGHYEMVEKVGLYWHFVDLVWVFVFTFFYLV